MVLQGKVEAMLRIPHKVWLGNINWRLFN